MKKIVKKVFAILIIFAIMQGYFSFNVSKAVIKIDSTQACNPVYILQYYATYMVDKSWVTNNTLNINDYNTKEVYKLPGNAFSDGEMNSADAVMMLAVWDKIISGTQHGDYSNFLNYCGSALNKTVKSVTGYIKTTDGHEGTGISSENMMTALGINLTIEVNKWLAMKDKFNLPEEYETNILKTQADGSISGLGGRSYCKDFLEAIGNKASTIKLVVTTTDDKKYDFAYGHEGNSTAFYAYLISEHDKATPTPAPTPKPTPTPSPTPKPTPTPSPTPAKDTEFKTNLTYSAKVDSKDVGGTVTNNYFVPAYDINNPKKDADVIATINATSANDTIAKINNETPGASSSSPSASGWYYTDSAKKTIAKSYPFSEYKNKNGIADLTQYTITGSDNNTDTKSVGVKWKFRIIDVSYNPENPTADDKTITVTITTNLPIDDTKVPDGWKLNPSNNCQISKTFNRGDGDISETVKVIQKGGDGSDSTNVKITWPSEEQFDTDLSYSANINGKDVGGKTQAGVFYPNYDTSDPKKDADVIATITTTTEGAIIEKINDNEIGESKDNPGKDGWYYNNTDKTSVSKKYAFETYDNSKDNGVVEEVTIAKKGSSTKTSKQVVSIKWPFRIIEHTTKDNGDGSMTETIETNLPMDPDKIPNGWTIVPGSDNHIITRTKKKSDGDINEVIDVYQNGTGDKDSTESKFTWPADNNQKKDNSGAKTIIPQTGEMNIIIAIVAAIVFGAIAKIKLRKRK